MKLVDKITIGIEEAGITSFLCIEFGCKERNIGKLPDKYFGRRHCMEQIPYVRPIHTVKDTQYRIQLIELCTHKIDEYWKK